jgi:hypothetical protein
MSEHARRRELERQRTIRRWVRLLAAGALLLVIVAVAGRLLGPVRSDDGALANDEFGACLRCVGYIKEQVVPPDGAEFPGCLLEVDVLYRGEGLYEVQSAYSWPAASGESGVQEYRCRAQRYQDGSWSIVDFRLED